MIWNKEVLGPTLIEECYNTSSFIQATPLDEIHTVSLFDCAVLNQIIIITAANSVFENTTNHFSLGTRVNYFYFYDKAIYNAKNIGHIVCTQSPVSNLVRWLTE
jgi:hypothetical protein